MHTKRAITSGLIIWILGVASFIASFFIPIMGDPELQANIVLMIAIIPCTILGARFYYKKGHTTHGLKLGVFLFLIAIVLDAIITVPVFIMPEGGNHLEFFTEPGFWLIGVEYVGTVFVYWRFAIAQKSAIA